MLKKTGLALALLFPLACSSPTEDDVHVDSFSITPDTIVTHLANPRTFFIGSATVHQDSGVSIEWTSSHPEIATVTGRRRQCAEVAPPCLGGGSATRYYGEAGDIHAYRDGVTTITATAGDRSKQITVIVGLVPVGAS